MGQVVFYRSHYLCESHSLSFSPLFSFFSCLCLPKALSHSISLSLLFLPIRSPLPNLCLVLLSDTSFACTTSGLWGHRSDCSVTGPEHMSHRHGEGACIGEWQQGGPLHCGFSSSHTHFSHPPTVGLALETLFHPTFSQASASLLLFLSLQVYYTCPLLFFPSRLAFRHVRHLFALLVIPVFHQH